MTAGKHLAAAVTALSFACRCQSSHTIQVPRVQQSHNCWLFIRILRPHTKHRRSRNNATFPRKTLPLCSLSLSYGKKEREREKVVCLQQRIGLNPTSSLGQEVRIGEVQLHLRQQHEGKKKELKPGAELGGTSKRARSNFLRSLSLTFPSQILCLESARGMMA